MELFNEYYDKEEEERKHGIDALSISVGKDGLARWPDGTVTFRQSFKMQPSPNFNGFNVGGGVMRACAAACAAE